MRYLSGPNPEAAREVLAAQLPDLKIYNLRLARQGWDNHTFILNDEWIVRFAKDEQFRALQERWVLEALQGVSPLAIPRLEMAGISYSFSGHRMLPGVQLSEAWPSCSARQRDEAIDRLAEFCAVMHSSLSVEVAREHGLTWEPTSFDAVRLSVKLGGEWTVSAQEALGRLDLASPESRVIHNDLHGDNILIDPDTHQVTAVIDFGDVAYGDPCIDLNYLCEFDLRKAPRIAERYARAGGESVDPQRILDLYFLQTLNDFLDPEAVDEERPRFREMIEEYVTLFGPR